MAVLFFSESVGGGGEGFFVAGFAVNDRGVAFFGIGSNASPYFHDVTACCVYDGGATFFDFFDKRGRGSECWDDDDVVVCESVILFVHLFPGE